MDEYNGLPHQPEQLPALPEDNEEQQTPRRPGAELYEWLQMFLGCVVAAVVLFNCVARLTRVDGGSMDTTLQHGEIMLIWSLGYTPKQGDIVVLNKTSVLLPDWTEPRAIVKRVIATGGQTVDVDRGFHPFGKYFVCLLRSIKEEHLTLFSHKKYASSQNHNKENGDLINYLILHHGLQEKMVCRVIYH